MFQQQDACQLDFPALEVVWAQVRVSLPTTRVKNHQDS
jgi:hypothetical protein